MNRRGLSSLVLFAASLALATGLFAQDKAVYVTKTVHGKERQVLTVDISKLKMPHSLDEFQVIWHNPPVKQDTTGTCWAFSTISIPRVRSEAADGQGSEVVRNVHRLLGVRGESPPLHP
ncbi:MAG: hypothetical protein GXO73_14220 [Calditrichaeota bacterium]|nr:hypothetical protein [Calditrichota bacterium]